MIPSQATTPQCGMPEHDSCQHLPCQSLFRRRQKRLCWRPGLRTTSTWVNLACTAVLTRGCSPREALTDAHPKIKFSVGALVDSQDEEPALMLESYGRALLNSAFTQALAYQTDQ